MKKTALLICILALIMALLPGCGEPEAPTPDAEPKGTLPPASGDALLSVWLINTGESDALLFKTDSGAFMVDTGLKKRFDAVEAALERAGVASLDAVIITHGHKDHIGGLKKLLKLCPVETIYTSALDDETFSDEEMKTILTSSAEHLLLRQGDSISLAGVDLEVLSPARKYVEDLGEDDNNNSLVLRASAGETTLLLMGDATVDIENILLRDGAPLDADILKAGRHGKDDASLPEFIKAVSPHIALLTGSRSDGDSSPDEAVLARFLDAGAAVYSNDTELLAVEIVIDGAGGVSAVEHAFYS